MRIVVGVDWSDETFSAVQAVNQLYHPQELILVHAVDVRSFEDPFFAPAVAKEAYAEFRQSLVESGEQLLERTAKLLASEISVRRLCEMGAPEEVILDTVRSTSADLVVIGARGLNRLSEIVLGSVSHHVLLHAPCSTLIVKKGVEFSGRILLTVEGPDDAEHLRQWLRTHPFNKPVEVMVVTVVPNPYFGDPVPAFAYQSWAEDIEKHAKEFIEGFSESLRSDAYSVQNKVLQGNPATIIADLSKDFDFLMVGSHGRKGLSRFLLGSVSHSLVHRVACSVLVVR